MKALDYHYNCIEVPLTPNNRVCDLARPSVRTKTKSAPFIPFPKEKKGPERLGNSWLPVLDFAILPCMSPVSRKTSQAQEKYTIHMPGLCCLIAGKHQTLLDIKLYEQKLVLIIFST